MTVISSVKQTLVTLKGIKGNLDIYAVQTENKEIREVFKAAIHTSEEVIEDLENRIQKLEFEEPQYKGH